MMLIKTHLGDGNWVMFEAHSELEYLGNNCAIELTVDDDTNLWKDSRFPTHGVDEIHCWITPDTADMNPAFVGWIKWRDRDWTRHMLVHQHPVFICNDRGDTVESIR